MSISFRIIQYEDLKPLQSMKKESVDFKYNPSTRYIGAFDGANIIGAIGWQMIGSCLRYKTDCVLPEYRKQGIYSKLWELREQATRNISRKKITAFCTNKSLNMYLAKGFFKIRERNGITFVEK